MNEQNFKSELLAPAGSPEALVAAVQGGCDAVYLGHKNFSARSSAANFGDDELFEAVKYCHLRGVKVYLAVNTLCLERQYNLLISLIKTAAAAGVDAVIVQDLGVCRIIKKVCPEMKIYASTQMTVHSLEGVELLYKEGIERVVLSRELSKEEIEYICKNTKCEIEVFVHGAICISYSGKCLFSSLVGGRSGNRGKCAQPCRLPYKFEGKGGNILSPKDMCLINHISALCNMGVCSLKIEGRMKSPEYVATVCRIYRKAIDGAEITKQDLLDLKNIFSRGGEFTDYYFTGKGKEKLIYSGSNDNAGKDVPAELLKSAAQIYSKESRFLNIDMKIESDGKKTKLSATYGNFLASCEEQNEDMPPIDEDRVIAALSKTGGTSFKVRSCAVSGDVALRISALNAMRRGVIDALGEEIINSHVLPIKEYISGDTYKKSEETRILARVLTKEQAAECIAADKVILPLHLAAEGGNFVAEIPTIITLEDAPRIKELIKKAKENGTTEFFCQSLDAIAMAKGDGARIIAGFSVNCSNFEAADECGKIGADEVILSCEIPFSETIKISEKTSVSCGAVIYGRMPLMITRHCVMRNKKCGVCKGEITDRMGISFPIRKDGEACRNVIYNSRPLYLADKGFKNEKLKSALVYFSVESPMECRKIIDDIINEKAPEGEFTRGHQNGGKW